MSPRAPGLSVNTQRHAASASLGGITLARHVTLALVQTGAAGQRVATEALPAILSASQAVALRRAVSRALSVGDFVVANIRKFDASENASIEVVGEAAFVGPASWNRWRSSGWGR